MFSTTFADAVSQCSLFEPNIIAEKLDDGGMVLDARRVLAALPLTDHIDTNAEPSGGIKFGKPPPQPGIAQQPGQPALWKSLDVRVGYLEPFPRIREKRHKAQRVLYGVMTLNVGDPHRRSR